MVRRCFPPVQLSCDVRRRETPWLRQLVSPLIGRAITVTAIAALVSSCSTYSYRWANFDTEGEVVQNCNTTSDEARRWMDACRRLQGDTHRLDTGELCFYTGKVAGRQYVEDGYRVLSTNCGHDRGDFMCGVTGDGCPIRGVYQQLPPS